MSKHHGYRVRVIYEIRNGDGNILHQPTGKRVPRFVGVKPLQIHEAVNEALAAVQGPTHRGVE